MSTVNKQTSTNAFSQQGMDAYNQMTPAFSSMATGYMNNPFSNPFFQQQQQMGNQQANMVGQSAMSNITRNMNMSGMGGSNNPAALEMMNNQSRQNSQMRNQMGFMNPMQNAFTAQQNFGQMASQFRPLQTGQTQTQSQSGLGSWLPQLAGAGLGIATGGMSGMAGTFAKGLGRFGQQGTGTTPMGSGYGSGNMGYQMNQMQSPFAQQQDSNW